MTVDEAYAFCRAIAHRHGANFSVGFRFLPRAKRNAIYAAYAYSRWADDIADEGDAPPAVASAFPVEASSTAWKSDLPRLARLDAWQRELDDCYAGRPGHPITIALADAVRQFAIPKQAFVDLVDGCRQDIVKTRYATFEELLHYCELVATSISEMSLPIFGYRNEAAHAYGRNLATALQLTNVTRDVGDDLTRDRVYIPKEELDRFEVSEADLFHRRESGAMLRLVEFQIDRAESYFRAAEPLLDELAFDARFPVLLMGGIYATVLAKLRKDPLVVIRRRVSLSPLSKLLVVGSRVLRPHFV